ncbi:rRNA-processing protein las1 [Ptychographa xylographoides]|nr:rRNA-processing protein las1 [Ptychographa xylographoides]
MSRLQLNFQPWKKADMWDAVKLKFYPIRAAGLSDLRQEGCNEVFMWKKRTRVPHAIVATALLTEAVLHDNSANTPKSIVLMYSSALTQWALSLNALGLRLIYDRLVTGIVDTQQEASYKKNMYEVAKIVGLPAFFVTLRHEIVHGYDTPLVVLRQAAADGLTWVYNDYWSHGSHKGWNYQAMSEEEAMRKSLESYQSRCRIAIQTRDSTKAAMHFRSALDNESAILKKICVNSSEKLDVVVALLVRKGTLVKEDRMIGSSMENVIYFWEGLLIRIGSQQRNFPALLVNGMLYALIEATDGHSHLEGLLEWLKRILVHDEWAQLRQYGSIKLESVIQTCIANYGTFPALLAQFCLDHLDDLKMRRRYLTALVKAFRMSIDYQAVLWQLDALKVPTEAAEVEDAAEAAKALEEMFNAGADVFRVKELASALQAVTEEIAAEDRKRVEVAASTTLSFADRTGPNQWAAKTVGRQ